MSEKICLVLHRKSANRPEVKQAVSSAKEQGHNFRVRIAWNKKDKRKVVNEALAEGAKRIIAGGGDGTINDVVNALVDRKSGKARASLGILPLGTANDFARGCELPTKDLGVALQVACQENLRTVDVGQVNKRLFINVVSGGFGAEVTATTPQEIKKLLGGAAYSLMGLAKAMNLKPYTGRLIFPGKTPLEGNMLLMAVGNNRFAGGGYDVAPFADLKDGLLDLAILKNAPLPKIPQIISELGDMQNPSNEFVLYKQASEFVLESDTEVHFNLDGEPMRETRVEFSVIPECIDLAVGSGQADN